MRSLRSRLTVAFALVAVAPLALAMVLFGRRVEEAFATQARDRLEQGLGRLAAQFESDASRLDAALASLARDAQLRRLFLLGDAREAELHEYLEAQRRVLGLSQLSVEGAAGGEAADRARLEPGVGGGFWMSGAAAITYRGEHAGRVRAAIALDSAVFARMEIASGVRFELGPAPPGAAPDRPRRVERDGRRYFSRTVPLAIGGASAVGLTGYVSTDAADGALRDLRGAALLLGALGVAVAVLLGIVGSRQVSRPVEQLAAFSDRVARGVWEEPLALKSVREIETLVAALERMRAELAADRERLRAAERQAAYGEMARKVAHEIKNPLTPIAISVDDLRRSFEQRRPDFPQVLEQAVRVIGEEIATLQRLIRDFSEFGRFRTPEIAPFEIAALFGEVRALFSHACERGRLVVETPASGETLSADRAQLRQALVNLIQNGLDAAPEPGRVRLRSSIEPGAAVIEVADDGPGLSPEQRERLFVPGLTTKAAGSGLGLAIVERIVHDHRGSIAVDSAPGRGTTFVIRLPRESGA